MHVFSQVFSWVALYIVRISIVLVILRDPVNNIPSHYLFLVLFSEYLFLNFISIPGSKLRAFELKITRILYGDATPTWLFSALHVYKTGPINQEAFIEKQERKYRAHQHQE